MLSKQVFRFPQGSIDLLRATDSNDSVADRKIGPLYSVIQLPVQLFLNFVLEYPWSLYPTMKTSLVFVTGYKDP